MLPSSVGKNEIPIGAYVLQLGGEGFRIGMGGGAASSRSGGDDAGLDFASVQRDNAEMQRRAQQVIETLRHREENPILSLHDVGAGGLANAVSELVHDAGRGVIVNLNAVPVQEQGMSAAEIWCNESQERYVLAILPTALEEFRRVCARESCPFAVIGETTAARDIVAQYDGQPAVHLPLAKVLEVGNRLQLHITPLTAAPPARPVALAADSFTAAAYTVLRDPTVACKRFLITIGDRTVGGLTAREQMVGPWQTPVADCAAIAHDFIGVNGMAFALGERAAVAMTNPPAAVRLAISEAVLNLFAAEVKPAEIKLSLNWMANCSDAQRQSELHAAVRAASDFCVALGIGVIVGKDSLSMRMQTASAAVESPAFATAFAFAPVSDVRRVLTPQLAAQLSENKKTAEKTILMQLTFSAPQTPALGASVAALAGLFSPAPEATADCEATALLAGLQFLSECREEELIVSYHDCSDGGAWATLCEMAFAANRGIDIFADTIGEAANETDNSGSDGWATKAAAALFNEAPAVIIEVTEATATRVMQIADSVQQQTATALFLQTIARPQDEDKKIRVYAAGEILLKESLADLRRAWEEVSTQIASERDNPACAAAEANRDMDNDNGLFADLPATLPTISTPAVSQTRPKVAILREIGTNGQREMAAAFTSAGFDAVDITMRDLLDGRHELDQQYSGAVLCGGFSYGDVLGAGRGWALGLLNNPRLTDMFTAFFSRTDNFVLGVCNGCQALAHLHSLMPDAANWSFPDFVQNESRRFEARLSMVEVLPSPSLFFQDMAGLKFPIVVSHGEGRVQFADEDSNKTAAATVLRYVDNNGAVSAVYPYNPNGSPQGQTGFCSPDGRITLLMPHPERLYRRVQMGWQPPPLEKLEGEDTPWRLLFDNARRFVN